MSPLHPDEERRSFAEEADSLWRIAFGPLIWSAHFLLCYVGAAIVCARLDGTGATLAWLRLGIGGATLLALAGIAWVGWRAWRQWDFLDGFDHVHDRAVAEDRHEFLGHASFLLAVISFVGVVYVALPAAFGVGCQ